jgi:predicted ArsR family transcriptional regulator
MGTRWDQRFFASTRGQVVALLRRASRTVEELARALGLTDNAVRAHLAALERDGLVRQEGVRRGAGKPAFAYDLTPDAERLFPKAYAPVLGQLLALLAERLGAAEAEALLREAGRRLAVGARSPAGDPRARLAAAVATLNGLGGLAEVVEAEDGGLAIQGYSCPLAAVAADHPAACALAESLVSELAGVPVRERCERGERPRCRFVVAPASEPAAAPA